MHIKTVGLIVREVRYQENYKLLTILTPELGKLTAKFTIPKGKNTSKAAACQLLSYSEFTLFQRSGRLTVQEAVPVSLFPALGQDLELLALSSYFAQVAEMVAQEDCPNPELLSLVLNSFHGLAKLHKPPRLVKAVFELRLIALAGYTPRIQRCDRCGDIPDLFDVDNGVALCKGCVGPIGLPSMSQGAWQAMCHILHGDPQKLFSFTLPQAQLDNLGRLTELYLCTQLERSFSTLDFYKSLKI